MNSLKEVASRVAACTDCPLSKTRTNSVPGEGPVNAEIMFIGEGPGFNEDKQGRPFVGAAGKFLEALLESIGIKREEVFIGNVVKCRPPNNRDPLPLETDACRKYLDKQIELIDPKLIVTLGRYATSRFFPGQTISASRGRLRNVNGLNVYPIYHPAAALHNGGFRRIIEDDFKEIPNLVGPREMTTIERESKDAQQLSMFSEDSDNVR
ncbi:uracil-DNA glycosylase [SAR202 cluster bacterium AC-409-J13_OGT_754m]|nr:uracil-DNA glycosylase [SAR202 cluster bacterium AC-409-J13_OGT_754m]